MLCSLAPYQRLLQQSLSVDAVSIADAWSLLEGFTELLYLLSAPEGNALNVLPVPALDREVVRVLGKTRRYMEDHLADPLTIPALSRMAMLSATTFKDAFRRLYGLPVHAWLRQRRMERAAELLRDSSLSVLGVAQSVGYGSASQFTAAFRRQYGMTPAKYRKDV